MSLLVQMGPRSAPRAPIGDAMPNPHILMVLGVLLAGSTAAIAGPAEYQSLDAMGLVSGKGMKTPCKVSGEYEGKTYCFRNEDAKAEFMKDPGNRSKADAYYGSKSSDHLPIFRTAATSVEAARRQNS